MTTDRASAAQDAEIAALRARVSELEQQLATQAQTTNRLISEAQEKLYWLERWHVDLDRVMDRPGALRALDMFRWVRGQVRKARRLKRRMLHD